MENSISPQLRRHFLGTWGMPVECLDNLTVPLPMFVLYRSPWLQSSPPCRSYIQLYFCCYVHLITFQIICAYATPHTLYVLTCLLLLFHLFWTICQKGSARDTHVLEQNTITQFKNKMLFGFCRHMSLRA